MYLIFIKQLVHILWFYFVWLKAKWHKFFHFILIDLRICDYCLTNALFINALCVEAQHERKWGYGKGWQWTGTTHKLGDPESRVGFAIGFLFLVLVRRVQLLKLKEATKKHSHRTPMFACILCVCVLRFFYTSAIGNVRVRIYFTLIFLNECDRIE